MAVVASALVPTETQASKGDLWMPPALFLHDWSTNLVVRSSWSTSVSTVNSAGEVRAGLAPKPSRSMDIVFLAMDQGETAMLRSLLQRMAMARTPVPLFCDQTPLTAPASSGATVVSCDTANRHFFAGALAAVWPASAQSMATVFDIATVSSVVSGGVELAAGLVHNYTTGGMIAPVFEADLVPQASAVYTTDEAMNAQLTFRESVGAMTLDPIVPVGTAPPGASVYGSYPIFNFPGHYAGNGAGGSSRANETTKIGLVNYTEVHGSRFQASQTVEALQLDRASAWALEAFFDSCGGQQKPFIAIDLTADFEPSPISGGDAVIAVSPLTPLLDWSWRTHLAVLFDDGSVFVTKITSVARSGGMDHITLTDALPDSIGSIARVTAAFLARFASDEMDETWLSVGMLSVQLPQVEVVNEQSYDLANMPTIPTGGALRAPSPGGGTDLGLLTPDYLSNTAAYWNGGADLPAGIYRISYARGALNFTTPPSETWAIHLVFEGGYGYGIIDDTTQSFYAPGATGIFATEAECISESIGKSMVITHVSGPIGMIFMDNVYSDNTIGASGAPTWRLQRLA